MTFLSALATIFGVASAVAIFPQVLKIYSRKSAEDVSILTYLFFFAGTIVWLFYGLELENLPIVLGNSIGGILNAAVVYGCLMYGRIR
ncbi:hypothetical protein GF336_03180 [Candidatus Woesearchaeota archaeon]|nr:hypothetical protein [Candidatus Woesearchaeota archaeon]